MGRRERLEKKLEKREEWAGKADARSQQRFDHADKLAKQIPLGQPILVGHHSEKGHRAHLNRIHTNMDKGVEESQKARHHRAKADGLEHQLDRSIFSDDDDAIENLVERIEMNENARERFKAINKAYRSAAKTIPEGYGVLDRMKLDPPLTDSERRATCRNLQFSTGGVPFPGYVLTNLGARIRSDKKRIEEIKRRQVLTARAEQAEGGVLIEDVGTEGYVRVTFPEKPEREILNALKAAGFFWSGGSWHGKRESLPEEVTGA